MSSPENHSINPEIRALSLDKVGQNLLVGTIGSEIYELKIEPSSKTVKNCTLLIRSHASLRDCAKTELSGLAICKGSNEFVTVSEDSKLRIWDMEKCVQKQMINLKLKAKVVDVDDNIQYFIIGFSNGAVQVINSKTGEVIFNKQEFETPVTVLRTSPDQTLVAIGTEGGIVKIYKFPAMKNAGLLKHSSPVTNLDWAINSKAIHTSTKDGYLLFWDIIANAAIDTGPVDFRDEPWATWTCLYGWPVQGLMFKQPYPIFSCARSVKFHDNYQLLAAGDVRGTLKLYRYPCIQMEVQHLIGRGHSSPISCIKFTDDNKYLFTTGLYDSCILQWELS